MTIPEQKIYPRTGDRQTVYLKALKWWDWPEEKIAENIGAIQNGRIDKLKSILQNNDSRGMKASCFFPGF